MNKPYIKVAEKLYSATYYYWTVILNAYKQKQKEKVYHGG